ncbi:hypothetical protein [Stappia indica]|uniref:hypothetical protein n=1 Tax=Stappia indica TaxID=538381 RepID=UPI001495C05E|nr:hypothetical protein [Stappia indica]
MDPRKAGIGNERQRVLHARMKEQNKNKRNMSLQADRRFSAIALIQKHESIQADCRHGTSPESERRRATTPASRPGPSSTRKLDENGSRGTPAQGFRPSNRPADPARVRTDRPLARYPSETRRRIMLKFIGGTIGFIFLVGLVVVIAILKLIF